MKVFSVIGISESGKTTTIENIIKELKKRKYTVGTVKEIHFEDFTMDVEGTNTYRHKEAGARLVTARGMNETNILFQKKLSINKILDFYDQDFVILEGVSDTKVPKIITAHDIEGIEDRLDDTVFAISGRIAEEIEAYEDIPVMDSIGYIAELVDLIEESVPHTVGTKRKRWKMNPDDLEIILKVNGRDITSLLTNERLLKKSLGNIVNDLGSFILNGDIEICIKR